MILHYLTFSHYKVLESPLGAVACLTCLCVCVREREREREVYKLAHGWNLHHQELLIQFIVNVN